MHASIALEGGLAPWSVEEGARLHAAVRRARRHSRLVRVLRGGLPASLCATLLIYGAAAWLDPWGALGLPGGGKLVISGTRITMEVPKLAGISRDGRAYSLTAREAAQDLRSPTLIELKEVQARIELKDDATVNITADAGLYDTKSEKLKLRENIVVKTSSGSEARLAEADMDVRQGQVLSSKPVEIFMPGGYVQANQMEVTESGAVVMFRGGVRTVVRAGDGAVVAARREGSE